MEELGQIVRSKDASLTTKTKIIHVLTFPRTMYGCESWTAKRLIGKQRIHLNMELKESCTDILDHKKDEQVWSTANEA